MEYELPGTHESDPLYQLLVLEDEVEADEYAAQHAAGIMQHNLQVEIERGTNGQPIFDEFTVDETAVQETTTSDDEVDALINYLTSKKG